MTPRHAPRAARPAPLATHYTDVRAASLALAAPPLGLAAALLC
jgi:hypothetical protein